MTNKYEWLNKDSRKFLERGYLLEGETAEKRIRDIAETAERYLNLKGFADKFEDYMARSFYSLSSPIWSNFGRTRGLPISCVTSETWINTKEDGGKMAKDIKIGDLVLTHKGRYRKVTDIIITNNRKNIFKLKFANRMTPLYITENHLILTNLGWVRVDELNKDIHLVAINGDIDIEEKEHVLDLKPYCKKYEPYIVDGKICKKISENTKEQYTKNSNYVSYISTPNEKIEIDEDISWAFGFWFAEGSLTVDKNNIPNGIRITYNDKDEKELGEKWVSIITNKFNLNGNTYSSKIERNEKINSWLTANINSHIIGNLFESFGRGCKEKLIPNWIINLPKKTLQSFLDGLLCGDGHITKDNGYRITVANPKMLLQIYQIGLKLGHQMSLQMQEKPAKLSSTKYVYTCNFRKYKTGTNKNISNCAIKFNDGLFYTPIKELILTDKEEDVYDFTVEEDHSFSAAGVVLHNCFGSYIPDTMEGIMNKVSEVAMMTKHGGGTSAYFGKLRGRGTPISSGGESTGSVHFMELFDKLMNVVSQGSVRRGSFATYLPIDHPDIEEFLKIRSEGNPIQNLSIGVCVSDEWMKSMISGDKEKRKIWGDVIKKRFESGYPYISFTDTLNNNAPQVYKDKGLKIYAQNLCNEIALSTSEDQSFVCDLSSLNLEKWEEWKDTDAVETLVYFLDAVMTEFINKTENIEFMQAPRNFAINQRALGVGVLGWHSLLQSKMIGFESFEAKMLNNQIWKFIREKSDCATEQLAKEYGEPPLLEGYGRRNTTTLAVAPTTSCTTKDTKFFLGNGKCVDYIEYCKMGGINLDDILTIELEDDMGKIHNLYYDTKVLIKRNNQTFECFAHEIEIDDDIIDII